MLSEYVFNMICPRCGTAHSVSQKRLLPEPQRNCADCLVNAAKIVPLKVLMITYSYVTKEGKDQ